MHYTISIFKRKSQQKSFKKYSKRITMLDKQVGFPHFFRVAIQNSVQKTLFLFSNLFIPCYKFVSIEFHTLFWPDRQDKAPFQGLIVSSEPLEVVTFVTKVDLNSNLSTYQTLHLTNDGIWWAFPQTSHGCAHYLIWASKWTTAFPSWNLVKDS